jgi:hypothetical protein
VANEIAIISLSSITPCGRSTLTVRENGVVLVTECRQWAYSAEAVFDIPGIENQSRIVQISLEVERGVLGVGLLRDDRWLVRMYASEGPSGKELSLLVPAKTRGSKLVFDNWTEGDKPARAVIRSISVLPGRQSYSQFGQDRFVVDVLLSGKFGGYFVEAGAGDGLWISNTLLLEKEFGWTGLLIEPTRAFEALKRNRPDCICENACLAAEYSIVTMVEIYDHGQAQIAPELAGRNLLLSRSLNTSRSDLAELSSDWAIAHGQYLKATVPLAELLRSHSAPKTIDYLSLDVEGAEYEVLRRFPFSEYRFRCLGIERPPPELHALLLQHGYVFTQNVGEDAFYVGS